MSGPDQANCRRVPLIAVTGLTGFLGARTRAVLEENPFTVESIGLPLRRSLPALKQFFLDRRPAAVIHMAGLVDVRQCREQPLDAFQAHVMDTANLLEALRTTLPETPFLYIATDKSFGAQEECDLSTRYTATFPYETSKACEDLLVESYRLTYGLATCLLRFPNFFGEADPHPERLVPSVCLAAANGTELVVRTRLDGTSRQFLYVRDAARIIRRYVRAMLAREPIWTSNHFGPPHIKTVGDVIRDVEKISGRTLNVRVLNLPGEVSRLSLRDHNSTEFQYTDWLRALRRTVEWYLRTSDGVSGAWPDLRGPVEQ